MAAVEKIGIGIWSDRARQETIFRRFANDRLAMGQVPLGRDINIAVNGCSWFTTPRMGHLWQCLYHALKELASFIAQRALNLRLVRITVITRGPSKD